MYVHFVKTLAFYYCDARLHGMLLITIQPSPDTKSARVMSLNIVVVTITG